jgi:hypothetical protein
MVDIIMKVALFASVTSLATAVAGLHNGFKGLNVVNVYWDARVCKGVEHVIVEGVGEWGGLGHNGKPHLRAS